MIVKLPPHLFCESEKDQILISFSLPFTFFLLVLLLLFLFLFGLACAYRNVDWEPSSDATPADAEWKSSKIII